MYDRLVKDRQLTLCVSGKLWNRSLLMMDTQTRSLWSHILGEAMSGELQGTKLAALPSEIVTWEAWKQLHPDSTVLAMPPTRFTEYTRAFYDEPQRFVVGLMGKRGMHHCSFATLLENPVLNLDAGGMPLVMVFDKASTAARLYSREVDEQTLTFVPLEDGRMRDEQTGSVWKTSRGTAVSGPLEGKRLAAQVAIVSYASAWKTFHPDSGELGREAGGGDGR